jgi:hypothetical protein
MYKKILVTAAGPNMIPVLEQFTLPSFEKFAEVNDYSINVTQLAADSLLRKHIAAKQARWQKIEIIRKALHHNDVVAWFDADIVITRSDTDILEDIGNDDFQGLVLHDVPAESRINPNTGVWVMKNSELSFEFLDHIEEIGMVSERWADQAAVMKGLGWNMGNDRHYGALPPSKINNYLEYTSWLPVGWNQPYCDDRPNPAAYAGRPLVDRPHAVHFMAMTIPERLKQIGQYLMTKHVAVGTDVEQNE